MTLGKLPEQVAFHLPGRMACTGTAYKHADGVPRQLYEKELLRVGTFRKRSTGETYRVGADLLTQMADSTTKYLAAQHKSPLTTDHDKAGDADASRGVLKSVRVEGDRLVGKIEAIGQDAIAAASRADVSIGAEKEWVGSDGNAYPWAINHVALTTDPVINGLAPFKAIAASQTPGAELAVLILDSDTKPKGTKMDLTKLAAACGITDTLTEDDAIDKIKLAFSNVTKKIADLTAERDKLREGKPVDKLALSNAEKGAAKRVVKARIESLVSGGYMTPGQAEAIEPILNSSDDVLRFSNDGGDSIAERALDTFKLNSAAKLAEMSEAQLNDVYKLSNKSNEGARAAAKSAEDAFASTAKRMGISIAKSA